MARKRKPNERKLRTREHIISDLSVNYVERQIFLRGFSVDEPKTDYGIDLWMYPYNDEGEVEPGIVVFQIKATDTLNVLKDGQTVSVAVAIADLKYWQSLWFPVILVIYDARKNKAYWIDVQQYLDDKNVTLDDLDEDQESVSIRIPMANVLGRRAISTFRSLCHRLHEQMKGTPKHGR